MWGAVVASTLTTVAVFLPVIFVQEEAGQLFQDIALAISAAVALSLLVSITMIPTATARLLRSTIDEDESRPELAPALLQRLFGRNGDGAAEVTEADSPSFMDRLRGALARPGAFPRVRELDWRMASTHSSTTVVQANDWIQRGVVRRLAVVGLLVGASLRAELDFLAEGRVSAYRKPQFGVWHSAAPAGIQPEPTDGDRGKRSRQDCVPIGMSIPNSPEAAEARIFR